MAVGWPDTVYRHPAILRYHVGDEERSVQLLDLDLAIDDDASSEQAVAIVLSGNDDFEFRATFSFDTDRDFEPLEQGQVEAVILREHEKTPLIDFLNGEIPVFYTADLSLVDGPSLWPLRICRRSTPK